MSSIVSFEGRELDREWVDGTHRVVPKATGKKVEPTEADGDRDGDR